MSPVYETAMDIRSNIMFMECPPTSSAVCRWILQYNYGNNIRSKVHCLGTKYHPSAKAQGIWIPDTSRWAPVNFKLHFFFTFSATNESKALRGL